MASDAIVVQNLNFFYGIKQVLFDISMTIAAHQVVAFIGASGSGKSTLLRCFNRMNDEIEGCTITGSISIDGQNIYAPTVSVEALRAKVGMVFQRPNPFPQSIYNNIAYGPRIHAMAKKGSDAERAIVQESLEKAGLWDEVKDRLTMLGTQLSGGQQQRLCIARAIAVNPEIILMDEPCSALDPIAASKIEDLIDTLRRRYTIFVVTHSMQQAARISQKTAFFHAGKLVEYDTTERIFTNPADPRTLGYITGRFG